MVVTLIRLTSISFNALKLQLARSRLCHLVHSFRPLVGYTYSKTVPWGQIALDCKLKFVISPSPPPILANATEKSRDCFFAAAAQPTRCRPIGLAVASGQAAALAHPKQRLPVFGRGHRTQRFRPAVQTPAGAEQRWVDAVLRQRRQIFDESRRGQRSPR